MLAGRTSCDSLRQALFSCRCFCQPVQFVVLRETKKSFKSLENREQAYKQMLKKREQDIMHLDDKLGIMEQAHHLRRYGRLGLVPRGPRVC